jgi:hypothetical protein
MARIAAQVILSQQHDGVASCRKQFAVVVDDHLEQRRGSSRAVP